MRRLRSRLPPVNALVAFEASARHLSFTRAAVELGVTREAVSRHIRILERHLGLKLFIREHRTLRLSKAGLTFASTVHDALENIADAAQSLSRDAREPRLTVTATVATAAYWLTPRLPRFRLEYPDVEIRVVVSDAPLDMQREGLDIGMRYGDGDWPALDALELFECRSFPICSPGYLDKAAPIRSARDLADHPLLNLYGRFHETEDWIWWLTGLSALPTDPSSLDVVGFDNYANVVEAALDSQGIALGFSGVVDELLASDRLVRPIQIERDPGHAVYLVSPRGEVLSEVAAQFRDWVLRETDVQPVN